ncbi:MAG: VWA domain-containing protein [Candidatus Obscuribacter phosphatis]|uniref:VWA domain-containing protein n=1 Tax=Candidatus Obscuribacter phosphatis TaxID=1906157 RepID=A0A8J7TN37_9BACT|nr:VWA domain-containing protein [Candidatus Obscuribacter phosphatis]
MEPKSNRVIGNSRLGSIITMSALLLSSALPMSQAAPSKQVEKPKLYGRVDQVSSTMNGAGIKIESLALPSKVTGVRLGSPAYYAGLMQNDLVDGIKLNGDVLQVTFQRAGKRYGISVRSAPENETESNPSGSRRNNTTLRSQAVKIADWKYLKDYEIYLLIDRSGSMEDEVDGDPRYRSRWEWVQKVTADFTREAKDFAGKSLTVVPFNDQMSIYRDITPENLGSVFRGMRPQGATNLMTPLQFAFQDFENRTKGSQPNQPVGRKLLIAVITDGEPQYYETCARVIVEATQKQTEQFQKELIFLGIGENTIGEGVFNFFDDALMAQGAKFDIVDVVNFDELQDLGIAGAMMEGFRHAKKQSGDFSDNELARMLKKLQRKGR